VVNSEVGFLLTYPPSLGFGVGFAGNPLVGFLLTYPPKRQEQKKSPPLYELCITHIF